MIDLLIIDVFYFSCFPINTVLVDHQKLEEYVASHPNPYDSDEDSSDSDGSGDESGSSSVRLLKSIKINLYFKLKFVLFSRILHQVGTHHQMKKIPTVKCVHNYNIQINIDNQRNSLNVQNVKAKVKFH